MPTRGNVRRGGRWETAHPAKYERAAQTLIRTRLAPVGDPHRTMLLGWDGATLGAVCSYRSVGSANYVIEAIAVATHLRRRGRGWAIEAITTALDYITADVDAHGYSMFTVAASIHEQNRGSQRLFEGQGFKPTDAQADRYQIWSAEFLVAGIQES